MQEHPQAPGDNLTDEQLAESIAEDRTEWLRERQQGLGASDIWPILNGGALRVYHSKTRPPEDDLPNYHQMRGRIMEPVFADLWAKAKGERIRRCPSRAHPDEPWARANIDRQILATAHAPTRLLEVKSPSKWMYDKLLAEGSRAGTVCQVQWGCYVTGYASGVYVAGNTDTSPMMFSFEQPRDDEFIALLAVRMKAFWHEHVEARVPPHPAEWMLLGAELTDALPLAEGTEPLPQISEARLVAEVERYMINRDLKKDAGVEMADAREILEAYIRHAVGEAKAQVGGYVVGFEQRRTPRKLDEDTLRSHRPIDRDAFVRWLRDEVAPIPSLIVGDNDELANRLSLDLDRFVTGGEPSSSWVVRNAKG